jgi:hypothetical protein
MKLSTRDIKVPNGEVRLLRTPAGDTRFLRLQSGFRWTTDMKPNHEAGVIGCGLPSSVVLCSTGQAAFLLSTGEIEMIQSGEFMIPTAGVVDLWVPATAGRAVATLLDLCGHCAVGVEG